MMVDRLLVTGDGDAKLKFHVSVCMVLNGLETRGRTTIYTAPEESRPEVVALATSLGLTVQLIHGAGEAETYETLCGDEPWRPERRRDVDARSRR